ncbi:LANO_0E02784g1_1 [Lachancea nothofagi CBS 11611]|uniref:Rhomboid-type serine protease 2 n=1 Tax=Lachancea nothofagi CBS 11611 TaxID=1266666 RepID=A0A1G4JQV5_9SACH|nr:LANO_0E02784g1_1 [Lachancea nothofagi CBS 11611]
MSLPKLKLPDGKPPAALSTGLMIFMFLLYVINSVVNINDHIGLEPEALFRLDLNRISLYPLGHLSFVHLLMNAVSLYGPLTVFERSHGTVHTGVILNLLAVFTAIPYCLLGYVFFRDTMVIGSSGWCFSLFAYFSFKESTIRPQQHLFGNYSIPTRYVPVLILVLVTIFFPGSSFWGHVIGLCLGYVLASKEVYAGKLAPPSSWIQKLESKLDRAIALIPLGVTYYKEADANREESYSPLLGEESVLPLHSGPAANFQGEGRPLGV